MDHLVACVAGAGVAQARDRVDRTLRQLQPQARVQVLPDFAAAYHAFDGDVDLVVIAGTGTVVCSPAGTGWRVSGGHGWILGDHGSASRLGRALLEAYLQDPGALPQSTADALEAVYGSREPGALVRFVHMHPAPGAALALAAPLLTELTAQGHALAKSLLDQQMRLLARTTAAHASDMTAGIRPDASWQPRVGLVGGVWAAAVARTSFARALADLAPELHIRPGVGDPLDGALRLAHTFATAR
ncbi:hypothetical protein [Streptacidiphilus monticola]|uniref:ATPase BadF/BadG/BcrA/BcrD type domain-containing protein n=1 Tax=Streptacidiphilus monticola TaxID=2161674 RepID=A0ABW1GAS4_9ACTN